MQKFTEFVKEHKSLQESKRRDEQNSKFNELYEAKLKEMGAKSPLDLSEEDSQVFFEYLKTLKEEELTKADVKKAVKDETKGLEKKIDAAEKKAEDAVKDAKKAGQDEVKDEKSFKEYAENVLKKAHGDDYDEKIADKVIKGIISKMGDSKDWGQAIGRLTSGLGG
jgi:hypothetical protein